MVKICQMLTCTSERRKRIIRKNKEITHSGLCASGRISPKSVRDIRVLFSIYVMARVTLPTGTTMVL